ncbi:MAG: S8 family serine peptidase [Planctomycetes bacterium]|nr:S8 family serine peptidase [Planctomycetota bacterium]
MQRPASLLVLAACLAALSATAQAPTAAAIGTNLRLQAGTFDPLVAPLAVPSALQSGAEQHLWIVQFRALPTQADRDVLRELGGEIVSFLPDVSYVVRLAAAELSTLRQLPAVRWVGAYHPFYRLDPRLLAGNALAGEAKVRYHLVVADKHKDKPALKAKVLAIGGTIDHEQPGSLLYTVSLTGAQLQQVVGFDEVLWAEAWTPPGEDVDNARIQGGANYIETAGGYSGQGVNVHIYEGLEATHYDFTGGVTNVLSGGGADTHGHATAGIVFGNGTSNPAVRGMAPNCSKFFTQYSSVTAGYSRWQVIEALVNTYQIDHTTASWGDAQVTTYTAVSADTDDIIFDHGIAWTQSQSNTGSQLSRPQAWAKNVFSIGGVQHYDNSNPLDDSYLGGGASRGPAADGRIKPDLCAFYDATGTSDLTGSAGYSANDWYASFGGTSGATPIVAGHDVLAIQMFTHEVSPGVGLFGNPLRVPGGNTHQNRPKFTTLKALQAASARQYSFTQASSDNRREHQGWGFPNLQKMYDNRFQTFVVDETDVLAQGDVSRWDITVAAGQPQLNIVMVHADPAANPAAAKTLINNLSIRVTAPNGTAYWGNNGLWDGNFSVAGGVEDDTNPIECVIVANPQAGVWHVDVKATMVVADAHVETPAVDADYGLVVSGGTGQPGVPPVFASFANYGQGCPGSVPLPAYCAQLNPSGGALTGDTRVYEYCYTVPSTGSLQVTGFDLYTRTTGAAQVVVPAHIYASVGGVPSTTPLASTTLTVGATAGFYTATFASPVNVTGTFYVSMNSSAQTVVLSQLVAGGVASGTSYYRTPVTGSWTLSGLVNRPSWRVICTGSGGGKTPALANSGVPTLGGSYSVTLADALSSTIALLISGTSDTSSGGLPLPAPLPNAPGCSLLASTDLLDLVITSGTGTASRPFAVPNSIGLMGAELFHQWAVLDGANALGIVVSNAGRARLGE